LLPLRRSAPPESLDPVNGRNVSSLCGSKDVIAVITHILSLKTAAPHLEPKYFPQLSNLRAISAVLYRPRRKFDLRGAEPECRVLWHPVPGQKHMGADILDEKSVTFRSVFVLFLPASGLQRDIVNMSDMIQRKWKCTVVRVLSARPNGFYSSLDSENSEAYRFKSCISCYWRPYVPTSQRPRWDDADPNTKCH
jgi:hypothetical protein